MLEYCRISGFADEIGEAVSHQIDVLKDLGQNYIELRSADGKSIADYTVEEAKALKAVLDENGIQVSAIGSPIGKIGIQEDFVPHFEKYCHVVDLAKLLGTQYIRIFSFYIPEGENAFDYREEVIYRLRQMINYAKEKGVVLLHENEKMIYGDTGSRCLDLMETLYGEQFKFNFDFANFVQCRENTLECFRMLRPYIAYIHIKDALYEDGHEVPAGQGDGHLAEIMKMLDDAQFNGFLSLEPHLADFAGFKSLEKDAKAEEKMADTEKAYRIAYAAMQDILGRDNK